MLLALYVDKILFFTAQIFSGSENFVEFIEDYEANHIGEVVVNFQDDGKTCYVDFNTYEDYLKFEEIVGMIE